MSSFVYLKMKIRFSKAKHCIAFNFGFINKKKLFYNKIDIFSVKWNENKLPLSKFEKWFLCLE